MTYTAYTPLRQQNLKILQRQNNLVKTQILVTNIVSHKLRRSVNVRISCFASSPTM